MRLRFAKLLLLLLFPLAGTAQTLPSLVPAKAPLVEELLALDPTGQPLLEQGAPVLPIWSGANGELLAVVALPRGWSNTLIDPMPAYGGPSAWHLAGSPVANAGGLRWQLGGGLHADAMFGQYLSLAPATCTSAGCDVATASRWSRGTLTGSLGMGWTASNGGLDLSYGLSWLQSQGHPATFGNLAFGNTVPVPVLTLPNARSFSLDSEASLYARGRWQFERGPALDVAASYGRGHLSALGTIGNAFAPGIDLDQLSLSLGLDAGSLRGAIVGHVLSSDDPALAGKRWTTLDLGVSWRTPWSGELSVGAQNLWAAPSNSPRDAENTQTRTPYIQYRQDL
ncbi:hypothetical protein [Dokdonella soli]|uniref:Autotransporter domain-containing protein n=1 Tax=Dokdonella soli TaxID=529810 RepID=A0ABP3TSH6_9GAMM